MGHPEDTWQEWSKHVLAELKRLNENIEGLDNKTNRISGGIDEKINILRNEMNNKLDKIKDNYIQKLNIEIAMLKVKSGVWGLIGGSIPVILVLLMKLIKGN